MASGMLAYHNVLAPLGAPILEQHEISGGAIVPTPGCLSTPPGEFPQINLNGWHNSPGAFAINTVDDLGPLSYTPDPNTNPTGPNDVAAFQVLNAAGNLTSTPAELFLHQLIDAFDSHQHVLLLWDVANEPHMLGANGPSDFETLIAETMRVIKEYPANQPNRNRTTCFSPVAVTNRRPATVRVATNLLAAGTIVRPNYAQSQAWNEANVGAPLCDVVAVHPYGHTRLTVDTRTFDAQHINPDPGATAMPAGLDPWFKRVFFSEIGYPGGGMSYADAVAYSRNTSQEDASGNAIVGVGYCPWAFMNGSNDPLNRLPYNHQCGFFYARQSGVFPPVNGVVKDLDDWDAVYQHASSLSIPGLMSGAPTPQVAPLQWPVSNGDDEYDVAFFAVTAAPIFLNAELQAITTFEQLAGRMSQLDVFSGSLEVAKAFSATNNGGPVFGQGQTLGFPEVLDPNHAWKIDQFRTMFVPRGEVPGIPNPGWASGKALVEAQLGWQSGTFQPETNPVHLDILKIYVQDWINTAAPYVLAQGGP